MLILGCNLKVKLPDDTSSQKQAYSTVVNHLFKLFKLWKHSY